MIEGAASDGRFEVGDALVEGAVYDIGDCDPLLSAH